MLEIKALSSDHSRGSEGESTTIQEKIHFVPVDSRAVMAQPIKTQNNRVTHCNNSEEMSFRVSTVGYSCSVGAEKGME